MKLYTEEQVRKAIELARETHQEGKPYLERDEYDYSEDEIVSKITPIELPIDEEIENAIPYFPDEDIIEFWANSKGFTDGAKYVINKIQGGNK